jgi:hypothetical protein
MAIKKIKSGKAPGPDNIPPEVLKTDPNASANIMIGLLQEVWEKERVPEKWISSHIVKLPKKETLQIAKTKEESSCCHYQAKCLPE